MKDMLIVVDMVNGFVREGMLHDEEIGSIIPRQEEMIQNYLEKGGLVLFIKDTHNINSKEFERFNGMHCLKGTSEAELVDELKKYENLDNVISIEKNSTSFMEAPKFRNLIECLKDLENIDIIGCCTDICVFNGAIGLANYRDEWDKKFNINVHEDMIATYGENNRKEYVDAAKLLMLQQGINLVKKGKIYKI